MTAGEDTAVQLWDVRSKKLVQHYDAAHGGSVNYVSFHPSGNFLLTCSNDNTVKVWDLREGQLFYTLNGHDGPATCCEFSQNGDYFATGGADMNVMVWKTNFDRVLGTYSPGSGNEGKVVTASSEKYAAKLAAEEPETTFAEPPLAPPLPKPSIPSRTTRRVSVAVSPPHAAQSNVVTPSPAPPATEPQMPSAPPMPAGTENASGVLPAQLASTLSHIVNQLDVLTRTMSLLEQRLQMNEDKTNKVVQIIGAAAARSDE